MSYTVEDLETLLKTMRLMKIDSITRSAMIRSLEVSRKLRESDVPVIQHSVLPIFEELATV